jgi:hypothetical protein
MDAAALAAGPAPGSFWMLTAGDEHALLLQFGTEAALSPEPPSPSGGPAIELAPLEGGALPLVPLWSGESPSRPSEEERPAVQAIGPLAVAVVGHAPPAPEASQEPPPAEPPPAVSHLLLGAEGAAAPPLPAEMVEAFVLPVLPAAMPTRAEDAPADGPPPADAVFAEMARGPEPAPPSDDRQLTLWLVALALAAVWTEQRTRA